MYVEWFASELNDNADQTRRWEAVIAMSRMSENVSFDVERLADVWRSQADT